MRLRAIGFWRSERDEIPTLPDPRDFLDPDWDRDTRDLVVGYLQDARRARGFMGYSACRLCGAVVGNMEHTDGTYLWPQGFAHYLEEHSVRPPDEFVEHVSREIDWQDSIERDDGWWTSERPTGSIRAWARWRIELADGASVDDLPWSRLEDHNARDPAFERFWRELRDDRVTHVSDSWVGTDFRRHVEELRLRCTITRELVAAPDPLRA